ncbi:hypothetical protein K443DRAFT_15922 [Laccaria amethystina LaAM-08-1]|uniref:Uncharacterized protein n=1 Tax=Laccaria amethystina LaAM-08-1 TaxID=1095629 RepID=A0A0C9WYX2_9AGAR|nr:hypothetical protein K443DRAFT_15922 [Laccaria amethystina LaAM-08-1]
MVKSNIKELEWKMTISGKNTDVPEELNPLLQPYQITMLHYCHLPCQLFDVTLYHLRKLVM